MPDPQLCIVRGKRKAALKKKTAGNYRYSEPMECIQWMTVSTLCGESLVIDMGVTWLDYCAEYIELVWFDSWFYQSIRRHGWTSSKLKIMQNVVQWLTPTLSPEGSVCCMRIDAVFVCNARTPAHEFFENVGGIRSFHLFHLMRTECMEKNCM